MRPEFSTTGSEFHLHRFWEEIKFKLHGLKTTTGDQVIVIDHGISNPTDGPDYHSAHIRIGNIDLYGDVEIHISSSHWYEHDHHQDPNYNNVVLHVVAEPRPSPVKNLNGAIIPSISLFPYLSAQQKNFKRAFAPSRGLNCLENLHFISEEAFQNQIQKAHKEYFRQKAAAFLKFYDPSMTGSNAWKKSLITLIFDGLGISHNRGNMKTLISRIFSDGLPDQISIQHALDLSGINYARRESIPWNLKSVSRADHPRYRIPQAVRIANVILQEPFQNILRDHDLNLWQQWLSRSEIKETDRYKILFGTVFIPAIYNAGQLYHNLPLSESAYLQWRELKTPIPKVLLKDFEHPHISTHYHRSKLGSIHQLRSYCYKNRCQDCIVLKKANLS